MKFVGIEISNFRSIGENPIKLTRLNKCNIVIGQNNTGKSNLLKIIKKISDKTLGLQANPSLEILDYHNRDNTVPIKFRLWFEADNSDYGNKLISLAGESLFWFDILWQGKTRSIVDSYFANITDFNKANELLFHLTGHRWTSRSVPQDAIKQEFNRLAENMFESHFAKAVPPAFIIPEFRQIKSGDSYYHNGDGIIKLLAEYQSPPIGKDVNQIKFKKVEDFVRKLLHLPNASLEFPRGEPEATLVINNNGLRLPFSSFGTGVHELIILVTAVLSQENSICCIEEPEIHLHPRLQREFIEFLTTETSNQYIITSHSPTLINSLATNPNIAVFHLRNENGVTIGSAISTDTEAIHALRDLGLKPSDLLQANCIIWVEGLSDRIYIQKYIELLSPEVIEGRDYIFMYYRSLPKLNFETDAFAEELINVIKLNPNAILVIDHDGNSIDEEIDKVKSAMKTQCDNNGGFSWVTDGREIENYLTSSVVQRACKDLRDVEIEINIHPFDEFSEVVDKALREKGSKPLNYSTNKINYSRKFAEYITKDDIPETLEIKLTEIIKKIREWNK